MPLELSWKEIALRLGLAALASACIGINRDETGRPAGLRTTMLVCLAATLAMIQVNLLLALHGKSGDNFNTLDLMRLPLGILSGIGFIGAGTIIKRGVSTIGLTTAATLWYVTVLGLLFGGGQLGVAIAASIVGFCILSGLKLVELGLKRVRRGTLKLVFAGPALEESDIRDRLRGQGFHPHQLKVDYGPGGQLLSFECVLEWKAPGRQEPHIPLGVSELRTVAGVAGLHWEE
jgi:putative Mg2+ transporter-C (MgtC) family protein